MCVREIYPIFFALSIVLLVNLSRERAIIVPFDRGAILVLDVKAMVRTTYLCQSSIDVPALENVAHRLLEVREVVIIFVAFVGVVPAPLLELVLEVALPRTL